MFKGQRIYFSKWLLPRRPCLKTCSDGCLVDMKLTYTIALQSVYHCRVNKCYLLGFGVNCTLYTRLLDEQVLIYSAAE